MHVLSVLGHDFLACLPVILSFFDWPKVLWRNTRSVKTLPLDPPRPEFEPQGSGAVWRSTEPGGRPGLSVLTSHTVFVDVKQYWTMLTHWPKLVPVIRGHQALHHRHHRRVLFPPVSVPADAGGLPAAAVWTPVFISGEILHCFLVGVNKSYVIAALTCESSFILPTCFLTPHPASLHIHQIWTETHNGVTAVLYFKIQIDIKIFPEAKGSPKKILQWQISGWKG